MPTLQELMDEILAPPDGDGVITPVDILVDAAVAVHDAAEASAAGGDAGSGAGDAGSDAGDAGSVTVGGTTVGGVQWVYDMPAAPAPLAPDVEKKAADAIWRRWMSGHKPARAGRQPVVTLFMGPTGSGKTALAERWAAREGVPFLDADTVSDISPDYAALADIRDIEGKPTGALNALREQQTGRQLTGAISAVFDRVLGGRYDVAMQWKGSDNRALGRLVADGYRLVIVWVATSAGIAADRYWSRARRTGRHYASGREAVEHSVRHAQEALLLSAPLLARIADAFFIAGVSSDPARARRVLPGDSTAESLARVQAALKGLQT